MFKVTYLTSFLICFLISPTHQYFTHNQNFVNDWKYDQKVIGAIMDGLGFVDYFNDEEVCVDNIEIFMWYLYYSFEIFAPPPNQNINIDFAYNATYSFTKMLG